MADSMTHFEHLVQLVPALRTKRILDLGSGEGRFAVEAAKAGAGVTGLEYYSGHITAAEERARKEGVQISFIKGCGEELPFEDEQFGFINMAEVLEHVGDPDLVLREAFRVLRKGGSAYLSAPNRFGMLDPHFRLYGINWMPRLFAEKIISWLNYHKDYDYLNQLGEQRLSHMHYYTYRSLNKAVRKAGFAFEDIRLLRIRRMPLLKYVILRVLYRLMRPWYFDSFHLLLSKTGQ